jgi:hypothetical protein
LGTSHCSRAEEAQEVREEMTFASFHSRNGTSNDISASEPDAD